MSTSKAGTLKFHGQRSEKTIYLLFFDSLQELPEEKARYFSNVDRVNHFALVAVDPDDPAEIIALVSYDREPDSESAERTASGT